MKKIYDGPDGKKYVETGEITKFGDTGTHLQPYLYAGKVNFLEELCCHGDGNKILRLATPEEIYKVQGICPACGSGQGCTHPKECAFVRAGMNYFARNEGADMEAFAAYALEHWKEFVKPPLNEKADCLQEVGRMEREKPAQPEIIPILKDWTNSDVLAEAHRLGLKFDPAKDTYASIRIAVHCKLKGIERNNSIDAMVKENEKNFAYHTGVPPFIPAIQFRKVW